MNGMMSNGHEKEEGERCNVMVPGFDGSRAKNNRKAKELEERVLRLLLPHSMLNG